MSAPDVFTFDYEGTLEYATGLAYSFPGERPQYLAWAHDSENNATENDARAVLERAMQSGLPWLAHNSKFDVGITQRQFGIDVTKYRDVHDTMFLMFLADPHALNYDLKQQAKRLIGYPTDDKDDMAAWVWEHARKDGNRAWLDGRKVTRKQKRDEHGRVLAGNAIEFVQQMPGSLVGRYGVGDINRTAGLFKRLWDYVIDSGGMGEPYARERQLMPILLENERIGMRVAREDLERDVELYQRAFEFSEAAVRKALNAPDLNIDADQDFAHALIRAGVVSEADFERTPVSKEFRVGKDSLKPTMFSDPRIASAVGYRNRLKTCLTMFMEPWLEQAQRKNSYVSTNWNQTRGGDGGTRTGRPSTTDPNFLNISKNFLGRPDGYVHPDFLGLPDLPLVRKYILPDVGGLFAHRDFSGQEMRVFAHYESGDLLQRFLADPDMDPHKFIADNLAEVTGDPQWAGGTHRTYVKNINFGKLYGAGIPRIMEVMHYSHAEAKALGTMHDAALPGRKTLNDVLVSKAKRGENIKTWGGRVYFAEEPRYVKGKLLTWEYKLLNYLVQGSAADLTKQCLIEWYNHPDRDKDSRFLVTVYDEINISTPKELLVPQMKILRDVMEMDRLDCPMRSDAKVGLSWGDAQKVKDDALGDLHYA